MIEELWEPCETCGTEPSCGCGGCEDHCHCGKVVPAHADGPDLYNRGLEQGWSEME